MVNLDRLIDQENYSFEEIITLPFVLFFDTAHEGIFEKFSILEVLKKPYKLDKDISYYKYKKIRFKNKSDKEKCRLNIVKQFENVLIESILDIEFRQKIGKGITMNYQNFERSEAMIERVAQLKSFGTKKLYSYLSLKLPTY